MIELSPAVENAIATAILLTLAFTMIVYDLLLPSLDDVAIPPELTNRLRACVLTPWERRRPAARHAEGFLLLVIGFVGVQSVGFNLLPLPPAAITFVREVSWGAFLGFLAVPLAVWWRHGFETIEHWEAHVLDVDVDEWLAVLEAREAAARAGDDLPALPGGAA